jgi:peptidoglycan/xylan/chitin deacetylase (PgdA/CDA1 family)
MNKLSVIAQWLVVAGLAAFVAYVLVRPTPQPVYAPEAWRDWRGVTILSYAGIARSDTPVYPSVRSLEAQLTALRDAGYRTVRVEDVRAFLDGRAPLPAKPLLLLFEGGRKEAFIRATPVLQRLGFSAVIAVPTSVMQQWGGFYLKRADIRKVIRLPQWQVASMGHEAVNPAPGGTEQERFLATRARGGGKPETDDAFVGRIFGDYARSASALEEALGKPALLYLYPYGEAGQSPGSDPLAEAANREAVSRHFGLAVLGGFHAFNGPGADPYALTRLRVPGDWSPERLLAELDAGQPRARPQAALGAAQDWTAERDAALHDAALHLDAASAVWLRGSDAWSDLEVSATLQPDAAATGSLYARYAGPRSWLRVAAETDGLRIQERVGNRLVTLQRVQSGGVDHAPRHVRLRLRNNRAWVWLDDKPVAENLPLAPSTRRGRVGFGSERGHLTVTAFSARPLPARALLANSIRLVPDERREQVQAILPNWFRAGEPAAWAQTAQQDLLQAAVTGIRTVPLLTGAAALSPADARAWAAAIDDELARANVKSLLPTLAVEGPADALAAELRNRGYAITHLLTPAEALARGRAIAQAAPDEILVINAAAAEAAEAVDWLTRVIPASRLAVRESASDAVAPDLTTFISLPNAEPLQR